MITVPKAGAVIAGVLGLHAIATAADLYHKIVWFDIPMHLAGGFAMGLLTLALFELYIDKLVFTKSTPIWVRALAKASIIVGFVMIVGVAWEWYEFIFDTIASSMSTVYRPAQMGLADTMEDLLFDFTGGSLAFILVWFRSRNTTFLE